MMNLQDIDEKYAIYGMLFSLGNRIQTYGDSVFTDITMKQHFMMTALEMFREEAPSLKEVGDLIGCSYQNVKRMAINLEKNGYLQIIQDQKDRRRLTLVGTGKFEELNARMMKQTIEFMSTLYGDITKEELQITLQTLIKMERNIGGKV